MKPWVRMESIQMAYFLDNDVFICTKNLHYRFDLCPVFRVLPIRPFPLQC